MKSRMMKKIFAGAMSATLVMGMSLTAFAADKTATVDAPIFSFDAIDVVVPTALAVAFNPDGLDVQTGASASDTEDGQVLSHKVGILNKSSKDKIVTVTLTVTDKNTYANDDDPKITFVDTAADATTNAEKGEYAIYLTAVPADATEVKVGSTPASADDTTAAADLANVTMTAATGKEVALSAGENKIAFKLDKATYGLIDGESVEITDTTNNVASKYEVKSLAAGGAGITAFTFDGAMNSNADWTKLVAGIEIKAVYTFANPDGETPVAGTGAMVNLSSAPTFTTGDVGVINLNAGMGDEAFASLTKITALWAGKPFDITSNATVSDDKTKITIATSVLAGWAGKSENPEATITYVNAAGDEKTATVTLKTFEAPTGG